MNKKILIVFFIIINYILIFVYPIIDDFSYYHMAIAINSERLNFVDISDSSYAGFYIFTITTHMLTNISYDILPTIPILSFSILILILLLFNYFFKNKKIYLLVILIFITQSSINKYSLFPHNMGYILFLLYLTLVLFFSKRLHFKNIISIFIIIIIISENFISYKYTFLILTFNLSLHLHQLLEYSSKNKINISKLDINKITLIGFIFTFSYNKWVYKSFLPKIIHQSEFSSSSGIEKLLYGFSDSKEQISNYFYIRPPEIAWCQALWIILIFFSLLLVIELLIRKIITKHNLSIEEKMVLCLAVSSILTLAIYSSLGMAEMGIIILTGFLGYGIIQINRKNLVSISIIILLLLNIYINILAVNNDYYGGQKDSNNFEYIKPGINWCINNTNKNAYIVNDIFTDSYFNKEIANKNILKRTGLFTKDRILILLDPNNSQSIEKVYVIDPKVLYYNLINYREHYFTISGWEMFNSWIHYKKNIDKNPYFGIVYSSGDINILFRDPNTAIF